MLFLEEYIWSYEQQIKVQTC